MYTFCIKFIRSDACLFERKVEWLPVIAYDRQSALDIFNKYLGIPFDYKPIDISVLEYESE